MNKHPTFGAIIKQVINFMPGFVLTALPLLCLEQLLFYMELVDWDVFNDLPSKENIDSTFLLKAAIVILARIFFEFALTAGAFNKLHYDRFYDLSRFSSNFKQFFPFFLGNCAVIIFSKIMFISPKLLASSNTPIIGIIIHMLALILFFLSIFLPIILANYKMSLIKAFNLSREIIRENKLEIFFLVLFIPTILAYLTKGIVMLLPNNDLYLIFTDLIIRCLYLSFAIVEFDCLYKLYSTNQQAREKSVARQCSHLN